MNKLQQFGESSPTRYSGMMGFSGKCFALIALGIAAGLAAATPAAAQPSSTQGLERGVTKPLHEPKLVFYGPGVVMKVHVKEGDVIKAGDVLAIQDDREELAKLEVAKGEVVSAQLQIRASEADLKQKDVALKRTKLLYADVLARGGSNTDIEQAEVAVEIGQVAVDYRKQDTSQKRLEMKMQEVKIEQKKLISPIDGIVAKIDVRPGEGTDLTKPAIVVVQNDTLYVEVDIAAPKAKVLAPGQLLQVKYQDDEKWMSAKIIFLTPYANPSSNTRKVRLEMVNEAKREAGLPVYIKLPENVAAGK